MTHEASGGTWRDVTVRQFRLYNLVSTTLGVIVFAAGLWWLVHAHIIIGLGLIAVGATIGLWTAALRIDGMPGPLYKEAEHRRHATTEHWSPRVLHFYTRKECSLCDEARARLVVDLAGKQITIVDHDVDKDPVLQRRYGDRVPVAVFGGGEVFALGYDPAAVRAL